MDRITAHRPLIIIMGFDAITISCLIEIWAILSILPSRYHQGQYLYILSNYPSRLPPVRSKSSLMDIPSQPGRRHRYISTGSII